jgi:predicted HAD superfamily Cof-like phosphohydrolase
MSKFNFPEPNGLNDVAKFHDTFGMPILSTPTVPSVDRCNLRISLLQEELDELKEALNNNDLIETADALADLQYVLSGAILEFGLGNRFKNIFDEVQRSNMSKTCKSMDEALQTQAHYQNDKGTESYIVQKENEWLVYRKEDGKVLKSINYSKANIAKSMDI